MDTVQLGILQELRRLVAAFALVSVHDEPSFVSQAYEAYRLLPARRAAAGGERIAALQTLCRHLYAGLQVWDTDACADTWRVSFVTARRLGANESEAQEIAQDITLQLIKSNALDDPAALLRWIQVVARRMMTRRRGESDREQTETDLVGTREDDQPLVNIFVSEDFTADVELRLMAADLVRILQACGFTTLQINVVLLCYIADLSIEAVSEMLNKLPENIRNLKCKAILKLRRSQVCLDQVRALLVGDSPNPQEQQL